MFPISFNFKKLHSLTLSVINLSLILREHFIFVSTNIIYVTVLHLQQIAKNKSVYMWQLKYIIYSFGWCNWHWFTNFKFLLTIFIAQLQRFLLFSRWNDYWKVHFRSCKSLCNKLNIFPVVFWPLTERLSCNEFISCCKKSS